MLNCSTELVNSQINHINYFDNCLPHQLYDSHSFPMDPSLAHNGIKHFKIKGDVFLIQRWQWWDRFYKQPVCYFTTLCVYSPRKQNFWSLLCHSLWDQLLDEIVLRITCVIHPQYLQRVNTCCTYTVEILLSDISVMDISGLGRPSPIVSLWFSYGVGIWNCLL